MPIKSLKRAPLAMLSVTVLLIAWPTTAAPREVSIATVISNLTKEARESWRDAEQWPRQRENYAQQIGATVDNAALLRILTRRLQRDEPLDAYIKWQIMSFAPDFSSASEEDYRRMLAVVPDLIGQPRPAPPPQPKQANAGFANVHQFAFVSDFQPVPGAVGGRQRLGVINGAAGGGIKGALSEDDAYGPKPEDIARAKVRQVERFEHNQRLTAAANQPIIAYRDTLVRELPDEGGVRLLFLLQDATERLKAGDPTYVKAIERLVFATDAIAAGTPIPDDVRERVIRGITQLAKVKFIIVTGIDLDAGEIITHKQWVNMEPHVARRMLENLLIRADGGQ